MKRLGIVITVVGLVALTIPALATEDGIILSPAAPAHGQYSSPDTELIEAWNDNGAPGHTASYGSPCFAFHYVPSMSYLLERIDWYAGDVGGQVTVEVRDGDLNGASLGSVTYMESPPRDWQGENLIPAVPVTAGADYYLVYSIVVGAQVSGASTGNVLPHWHDPAVPVACSTWSGPFNSLPWRARFYGSIATPVEEGTWGQIRNVYR